MVNQDLKEASSKLTYEDILNDFESLLKYLRLAKRRLKNNSDKIIDELEKYKAEVNLQEVEGSIDLILKYINKWFNLYKDTGDILQIRLKEFEMVQGKAAELLDICYLYDLYIEVIDFKIGCIGGLMCIEIRKGGKFYW